MRGTNPFSTRLHLPSESSIAQDFHVSLAAELADSPASLTEEGVDKISKLIDDGVEGMALADAVTFAMAEKVVDDYELEANYRGPECLLLPSGQQSGWVDGVDLSRRDRTHVDRALADWVESTGRSTPVLEIQLPPKNQSPHPVELLGLAFMDVTRSYLLPYGIEVVTRSERGFALRLMPLALWQSLLICCRGDDAIQLTPVAGHINNESIHVLQRSNQRPVGVAFGSSLDGRRPTPPLAFREHDIFHAVVGSCRYPRWERVAGEMFLPHLRRLGRYMRYPPAEIAEELLQDMGYGFNAPYGQRLLTFLLIVINQNIFQPQGIARRTERVFRAEMQAYHQNLSTRFANEPDPNYQHLLRQIATWAG